MVQAYWAAATRGMLTPACRHTNWVNPEQSKEFGPVPPQRYGLPSSANAHFRATVVVDSGGGMAPFGVNCREVADSSSAPACDARAA